MSISVKVGDTIPEAKFLHVAYTPELDDALACGVPTPLSTNEWAGKKVVIFAVPGAFTPTCHVDHLPQYLKKYEEFTAKGVDVIAVVAANDPFVLSGWARVEGLKGKILALTDTYAEWSAKLGLSLDLTSKGLGIRTARYAIIIDDLKIKYIAVEAGAGVTVSGADAVLAQL